MLKKCVNHWKRWSVINRIVAIGVLFTIVGALCTGASLLYQVIASNNFTSGNDSGANIFFGSYAIPYSERENGNIQLINSSSSTAANNLITTISIMRIDKDWENAIESIDDFDIMILPPSTDIDICSEKRDVLFGSYNSYSNNAFVLKTPTLPPKGSFAAVVRLKSRNVYLYQIERDITIISSNSENFDFIDAIKNYLDSNYVIATFQANASCDNVIGNIEGYNFNLCSYKSWGISSIQYVHNDRMKITGVLTIDYYLPFQKNVDTTPIKIEVKDPRPANNEYGITAYFNNCSS